MAVEPDPSRSSLATVGTALRRRAHTEGGDTGPQCVSERRDAGPRVAVDGSEPYGGLVGGLTASQSGETAVCEREEIDEHGRPRRAGGRSCG